MVWCKCLRDYYALGKTMVMSVISESSLKLLFNAKVFISVATIFKAVKNSYLP